ncbi:hypothetical protein BU15DRAFT_40146 [Melanogaster broomeanus]|nr:hypothetical protein BU15DRAFT_40146 [Melanogaster broomeanus]
MANTTALRKYKESPDPSGVASLINIVGGNGRVKRGQLAMLPSLPLDILYEIFCFLCPGDLLALVRTSTPFRRLLTSRSSAFIWRAVRRNLDGLPEPPSDMNEIQYAALVFGGECQYEVHQPRQSSFSVLSCLPSGSRYDMAPSCSLMRQLPVEGFHGPHVKALKDQLLALSESEHEVYLQRRQEETELINNFAAAGVEWQLKAKKVRIMELRSKRAARAEVIREMLVEAGCSEEIEYFGWDRISRHPVIKSSQALTDKARSSILAQLEEYISAWQELRIEERVYASRRGVFLDAWLEFTTTAFYNAPLGSPYFPLPPSATIGFSPSIDSVIRQPGQVSDESLLEQLYSAFLPACDYILEWHREVRRELASLLPGYKPDDDDRTVHARLKLATSVFRCTTGYKCRIEGHALAYPEILFHPCFTLLVRGENPSPKDPRTMANQKACLAMGGRPWSCKGRVQVHHKQDIVVKILSCCGKDPRTTTAEEMDTQDPRLTCLVCAGDDGLAFMSWRPAVSVLLTMQCNRQKTNCL